MPGRDGHAELIEQVVEQLKALRGELKTELRDLRVELKSEIGELRTEMRIGFVEVNLRIDKVIENTGSHYRTLEARVAALEAKVH